MVAGHHAVGPRALQGRGTLRPGARHPPPAAPHVRVRPRGQRHRPRDAPGPSRTPFRPGDRISTCTRAWSGSGRRWSRCRDGPTATASAAPGTLRARASLIMLKSGAPRRRGRHQKPVRAGSSPSVQRTRGQGAPAGLWPHRAERGPPGGPRVRRRSFAPLWPTSARTGATSWPRPAA